MTTARRTTVPTPSDQGHAESAPPPGSDLWLADALCEAGVISRDQADEVKLGAVGGIWRTVAYRGYATDSQILEALASRFKVLVASLPDADPRVAALLPEAIARRYQVIALTADDRVIRIATSDPRDLNVEQTLAFVTGRSVDFRVAAPDDIARKIEDSYSPDAAINRLVDGLDAPDVETIDETPALDPIRDPSIEAPMARLVEAMIADGVRERASDIHCEPLAEGTSIRYRIDGVLREVMRLPPSAGPVLVRRVKIVARLDVTDPLHPHDGRSAIRVDGKAVDLRVSTVPVARRGEKVVIRILDKQNLKASIPDLTLPAEEEVLLQRLLAHRDGIVLVTGPTGSGKTTTLYAAINQLKTGRVNIVTVEDPVEYDLGGVSQLQVNEAQGFTFATALRSVLRQDPDIVLVGEIRDAETAAIATQASLSGHLVLSTLHTNDAASAVIRLRDLGVDSFKIAAALKGIIAQRLVRRICPACSTSMTVAELPREATPPLERGATATPRRAGDGCKACSGTGYHGRLAIFEVLPVDDRVAHLIGDGALPDVILNAARPIGARTLWESGLERVWRGVTTLEEVMRVLGERPVDDLAAPPTPPLSVAVADHRPASEIALPKGIATSGPESTRAAIAPEPSVPVESIVNPPGSSGKARILVTDDDRQMRRLIRMILERAGHDVAEAADGLDALEMIEGGRFDLMILDIEMPRLDGMGVLEELRARVLTSSLPVIVLTSQAGESENRVFDLGAQDFLAKPVQPQSLQTRVRAVLRRAELV